MIDFGRKTTIVRLRKLTATTSDDRLMDYLQTAMSPTFVSDNAVSIDDVPKDDLDRALEALRAQHGN